MAKTAAERKQEERRRNKMSEEDRLARLLSRRLSIDLFHNDDAKLKRSMQRTGIEEEQDLISRLIHAADRMTDKQLAKHIVLGDTTHDPGISGPQKKKLRQPHSSQRE